MWCAPALANASTWRSGRSIIRCTSRIDVEVAQRLDRARPHRQRRHEVAVHDVDVDHARAGGDDLVDLLAQPAEVRREDRRGDAGGSYLDEHAAAADVAGDVLGAGHAHDRAVLAAVRADRAQLEAVQAGHAAIAPGEVRRAQPGLVAGGALHAERHAVGGFSHRRAI